PRAAHLRRRQRDPATDHRAPALARGREMSLEILQPPGWPRPKGYANGIAATGRMVFVSGMVGWNAQGEFESDALPDQVGQALKNAMAVLHEAGAGPRHVVRMTWYLR